MIKRTNMIKTTSLIKDEIYDSMEVAKKFAQKNKAIESKRLEEGWKWVEIVENNVKTLVLRKP